MIGTTGDTKETIQTVTSTGAGEVVSGLAEQEAAARRARGEGNNARLRESRTYLQILTQNVFTFINMVLFGIGALLIVMDRPSDAVVTAGLVLLNVIVGVVQEARAKRKLDQIALLTRPKAAVMRDGQEKSLDPSEIVLGDALVVRPGDQVVVDGEVVGPGSMEADESLLTGESDPVAKRQGDKVYSGSFCVTGSATYVAQKVGEDSYAHKLTEGARTFRAVKTPLQKDIDLVVRLLALVIGQIGLLLLFSLIVRPVPVVESVQIAAVIIALIPQGLFFMITITYAMGAVRMAGRGALIQQSNAVESMSNVDVLCTDKTGTLTTNALKVEAFHPLAATEGDLRALLADYSASTSSPNRTSEAIHKALGGQKRQVVSEVPFSSERKWSAISFEDGVGRGSYVLGAPEMLQPNLDPAAAAGVSSKVQEWAKGGLRVLLFARLPDQAGAQLRDTNGQPTLPPGLQPLGLISLRDEMRPDAHTTLEQLERAGISLKVISGDNPDTVLALARQAGLGKTNGQEITAVSGLDLDALSPEELERTVGAATIFGRITPKQKESLVRALQSRGHYVAMIGDGVNDVLSLKQAQLGVAMQTGSQAARGVADIVLLNDSFSSLPWAFSEGQRIVNGMQDVMRLLLSRTFAVTLLIIATAIVGVTFPLTPKYTTVQTILTVGIPTLVLAAWARPGRATRSLRGAVLHFVLPASYSAAILMTGVYLAYLFRTGDVAFARTALTAASVLCGLLLIVFAEPPTPVWVGGDELSGDWRPSIIACLLLALYAVVMLVPDLRLFFELTPLSVLDYLLIGAAVAAWALLLRWTWRGRQLEKVLDITTD